MFGLKQTTSSVWCLIGLPVFTETFVRAKREELPQDAIFTFHQQVSAASAEKQIFFPANGKQESIWPKPVCAH